MQQRIFKLLVSKFMLHGLAVFTTLMIGTACVFYHHVEKWAWIDSLYFSVVTISTLGYGDLSPHTTLGKLFTIGYLLLGLGLFATITASLGANLLHALKAEMAKEKEKNR